MTKIIINGCSGHMGQVLTDIIAANPETSVVAGVDARTSQREYPIYEAVSEVKEEADCVIDFSTAACVDRLLEDCMNKKLPLVLCTTGLSPEQLQKVEEASKVIPILRSANMSLGINLLFKLVASAASVLAKQDFDMEIVEMHHRRKLDAPSGTAIALAEAIQSALDEEYPLVYNRSDRRQQRPSNEIGISAVRGGTIVGVHNVIFAGQDEVIEINHTAYSRAIFAKGAVAASVFLAGQEPGMYDMSQVIG